MKRWVSKRILPERGAKGSIDTC
jgi:hypothetical protein